MADLELNFLGNLEVVRQGRILPLPPSKKTRALLAYIALHDRSFRRERLCELLWEVPDDPRGSLRWSLSKLRRLVDDDEQIRIVADRTNVRFDGAGTRIDLLELKRLAAADQPDLDTLEQAAERYRGNFLEGLELSNFHDFHGWCVAERESAVRAQIALFTTLVDRLGSSPERALPHARTLVEITPYDEAIRSRLIRLLVSLGRVDEAEQQFQIGGRMLAEIGAESTGELRSAWQGATARTPGPVPKTAAVNKSPPVRSADPVMPLSSSVVGREAETAALGDIYRDLVGGGGAKVVLLSGEPGIGKTRLLELGADFAAANDAYVLEASAFESETIRPFAVWIDALRRRQQDLGDLVGDDDLDQRDRLFAALSKLLAGEAASRPVMLLFDDLHWADESSAAALHYVFRMNLRLPVMAILAARDAELRDNAPLKQALRGLRHDGVLSEIRVGPLSEAALARLIADRAPEVDGERLARESAGNPLLAVELARAESAGSSGGSLNELVGERMSRFDLDGAEVLRWAAVVSPRIDVGWLTRLTGFDSNQVGNVLEQAERQAMLRATDSGFSFAHDLIASSVYTEISLARRQVMHRRVAELAEEFTSLDLEHAADLAHHALHSGDPDLASRAMVSASRLCLRFFANDEALALARRGLQLATQLSDAGHVCRRLELYEVMMTAAPVYEWEAAAEEYAALAERALDHGALGHARLGYHLASVLRWAHGHWSGAREQSLQAERVTRGASEVEHVIGMAETAKCLALLERDLSQADALLMEAEAIAVRSRLRFPSLSLARGMLKFHENAFEAAEELFEEARTLSKSDGDRVSEYLANEHLVMISYERGRIDEAARRCGPLAELGGKLREGSEGPFARALGGLCRLALDDEARALEDALDELRVVDAKHRLAYALIRGALVDLERNRLDLALARAEEALGYAELLERGTEMLLARAVLCRVFEQREEQELAAEQRTAMDELLSGPVAAWARARVLALTPG